MQGNGQTELTEAILGPPAPRRAARSRLDGEELVGRERARRILDAGVGFVPEDRSEDGLVGEFTIAENLMLDRSSTARRSSRRGTLQLGDAATSSPRRSSRSSTSARRASTRPPASLSGGNQQKVVWPASSRRDLRLLVAAQPTRGVDVGSIEFIHKQIVATRDAGIPVLVVSTELDEVVALADRIMVMYRGRIVGIVPGDTPREVLGLMMAGERPEGRGRVSDTDEPASPTPDDAAATRDAGRRDRGRAAARSRPLARVLREIATGNALVARARRRARGRRRLAC